MSAPSPESHAADPSDDPLIRHLSDLKRYAGWLSKDHVSIVVRAEAQALGAAVDQGQDPSSYLEALDKDIKRLPSGGLRKMLRRACEELRTALETAEAGKKKGDRP
jgi:hypothetical protein